jgi:superfamily II DNA helicase RecQ
VYSGISRLRNSVAKRLVACTAAADEPTRWHIIGTLALNDPQVVSMRLRRENMSLFVTKKHSRSRESDLVHTLRRSSAVKVLVFCRMRDEAERASKVLNKNGNLSVAYHSAINNREEAMRQFESGVVVV